MAYTPTDWSSGDILTDPALDKLEMGVADAHQSIDQHKAATANAHAASAIGGLSDSVLTTVSGALAAGTTTGGTWSYDAVTKALSLTLTGGGGASTIEGVEGLEQALADKADAVQITDMVKAAPGAGETTLLLPGDTDPGVGRRVQLGEFVPGSRPPALDVAGSMVGASVADPAMATVGVTIPANRRVVIRIPIFDDEVNQVRWSLADSSALSVTGEMALLDSTAKVIRYAGAGAISPGSRPAGGAEQGWTFVTLTGLVPPTDLFLTLRPSADVVIDCAPGRASFVNAAGQRTTTAVSRAAYQAGTTSLALNQTVDLSTGWTRHQVPVVVANRTAA